MSLRRRGPIGEFEAPLDWKPQFEAWAGWTVAAAKGSAVAQIRLADGLQIELHVDADDSPNSQLPVTVGEVGIVACQFALPAPQNLRTLDSAMSHIRATAVWRWIQLPAGAAQVLQAIEHLDVLEKRQKAKVDSYAQQRALEALSRQQAGNWDWSRSLAGPQFGC